jgi:hypothetical protein
MPIALILRHVQSIDDCHATGQLALCLNLDVVFAPIRSDRGIEGDTHGHRIRKANSIFTGLGFVSLARMAVALNGEMRELGVERLHVRNVVAAQYSGSAAEMPSDQLNG